MHPLGVCGHSGAAQLSTCLFDGGEDSGVRGVREVGCGEAIPGVWEQIRVLNQQLGSLPLGREQSIVWIGQQRKRRAGLRRGCWLGISRRRPSHGRPAACLGRGAHHLCPHLLDIHAEQAGQLAGVARDQRVVPDACDEGAADRSAASRPSARSRSCCLSTLPITKRYSGTRRATSSRTAASPRCSLKSQGSRPVGSIAASVSRSSGHLRTPSARPPVRRIAVEGEDHLTTERVMIAHQPAQQPSMIITEGGSTRRDRRVDPG